MGEIANHSESRINLRFHSNLTWVTEESRITQHAGQTRILLTVTHASADHIKALVANVRAGLQHIRTTAPQFTVRERWQALVRYIVNKIIFAKIQNPLSATAPPICASQ